VQRAALAIAGVTAVALGFGGAWYALHGRRTASTATAEMPRFAGPAPGGGFRKDQVWRGEYVCAQGATSLELTITGVDHDDVRATFSFRHAPTGRAGEYLVSGTYDPATRHIVFTPGDWIREPPNYFRVGMDGRVAADGGSFSGTITHETCTSFLLHLR
jgi:hypothetical protein